MEDSGQGSLFASMGDSFGADFFAGGGDGSIWTNEIGVFSMVSHVEEILDQGDFVLEDLLDEGELLQEVKGMNTKLLEYLSQREVLGKLIDYCTLPTKIDSTFDKEDEARFIHKFPYVACEVICCDMKDIVEPIMFDDFLLMKVFQVLDSENPIEPRLAGYFHKIFCVLIARNPEYMLLKCSSLVRRSEDDSPVNAHDHTIQSDELVGELDSSEKRSNNGDSIRHNELGNSSDSAASKMANQNSQSATVVYLSDWLLKKLLKHLDNYSVMSVFRTLFQISCRAPLEGIATDTVRLEAGPIVGEWGDTPEATLEAFYKVRGMWSGSRGTALELLSALESSSNSDLHNNASDLLSDMLQQVATPTSTDMANVTDLDTNLADALSKSLSLSEIAEPSQETNAVPEAPEWCIHLAEDLMKLVLRIPDHESHTEEESSSAIHGRYHDASEAVAGLAVLIQLVDAFTRPAWCGDDATTTPAPIKAILVHLPQLCESLRNGSEGQARAEDSMINTQWGGKIVRLGMRRFKIVQLLFMLVHSKYPEVINTVATIENCPLEICLDLFFDFEWNNVLHAVVETLIRFILTGGVSDEEIRQEAELQRQIAHHQHQLQQHQQHQQQMSGPNDYFAGFDAGLSNGSFEEEFNTPDAIARRKAERRAAQRMLAPLQDCLFTRVKLVDRLLDAYDRNGESIDVAEQHAEFTASTSATGQRAPSGKERHGQIGYMGFCHLIANSIREYVGNMENQASEGGDDVETIGNQYAFVATQNERWKQFVEHELAGIIMVENCLLGGTVKPSRSALDGGMMMGQDGDLGHLDEWNSGGFVNFEDESLEGLEDGRKQSEANGNSKGTKQFEFGFSGSYDDESDEEDDENDDNSFEASDLQSWNPFQNDQDSNAYFEGDGEDEDVEVDSPAFEADFGAFGKSDDTDSQPLSDGAAAPSQGEQKGWATNATNSTSTFDPFAESDVGEAHDVVKVDGDNTGA